MITSEQINQCKTALVDRQTELIDHVQDHFGKTLELAKESVGELSNYDNHPADMGTELYEREKDIALNEHAEMELEDINAALHAIEDGTYGICSKCGEDIPLERLEAVPTADRCIAHANETNFERSRPVEEEVFSPNINPDEVTDEEQVGYDAEDAWQEVSHYGTSETPSDFYGDKADYDEMYPNSDENVGDAEDVEGFISADMDGTYSGVTPNHNKYEGD
ncbi:YteA family regulatory protein [Virgibacillus natechei]|uniref:YteA family regulatory protein n=1 Tax=Virgibacillus natechei TaxID=1216297 RepID=A0ABS4ICG1_9BACI|nr:yteA family sporulation protein [Virgibacillus natechei]MBP1968620.1 YteA family regulatory protein [Virgibacillus natechei]UZD13727.1 yteA family sporulation protein [Virgibacillus natechei]